MSCSSAKRKRLGNMQGGKGGGKEVIQPTLDNRSSDPLIRPPINLK